MSANKETRLIGTFLDRLNGREDDRWYKIYNALTERPDIVALVEVALAMSGYLQRLVGACNFAWVWDGIAEAHYPPPAKPVSDKLEYVVFAIKQAMNRAEIIASMAAEGLRPATLYEMLVWAAKNPKEGTQYWVVALEQYFSDSGGGVCFACVDPRGLGRRELNYYWLSSLGDQFRAGSPFLAVRKSCDEPLAA